MEKNFTLSRNLKNRDHRSSKMRVFSGLLPLIQLIDEYEAPPFNLGFDGFKAILNRKTARGAFRPSPFLQKAVKK
jgi:hypothetical protein